MASELINEARMDTAGARRAEEAEALRAEDAAEHEKQAAEHEKEAAELREQNAQLEEKAELEQANACLKRLAQERQWNFIPNTKRNQLCQPKCLEMINGATKSIEVLAYSLDGKIWEALKRRKQAGIDVLVTADKKS